MPDDKKPGTSLARAMLREYRKNWSKRKARQEGPTDHGGHRYRGE